MSTFYQHGLSRRGGRFGTFYALSHCHSCPGSSHRTGFLVFARILRLKAAEVSSRKTLLRGRLCQTGSHLCVPLIEQSAGLSINTRKVSADMQADIDWWLAFLPLFNGTSFIKPQHWEFDDLQFTTDASMNAGGATCLDECFTCEFPDDIVRTAQHITALELYTIVVAVKFWAPKLRQRKFIV